MNPRVLVSHPHAAAFSNGAAAGFANANMLSTYVTGVAAAPGTFSADALARVGGVRKAALNRIIPGVSSSELLSLGAVELGARALGRAGEKLGAPHWSSTYNALFLAHDAAVAALPWPSDVTAVFAYEDGALWTFQKAAKKGLVRIWDLPLPHYRTIHALWREEARRWPDSVVSVPSEPEWKTRRKDAELELADFISVASAFTQQSLMDVGVEKPICITPYGFATEEFTPKARVHDGPFTAVSVGTHDLRKGTVYLLEAWKRAAIPNSRLILVGTMRLARSFLQNYAGVFEHVPYAPKAALGDVYRHADVLAFPTLGDGFGLVIQEAMCCGTPVITTRCGGGPEVIRHNENGWILPERDIDALVETLREAARDRDRVFQMGVQARRMAESWSWKDAGTRLATRMARVLRKEDVSFSPAFGP